MESSDPDLQSDHGSAEVSLTIEPSDDHSANPKLEPKPRLTNQSYESDQSDEHEPKPSKKAKKAKKAKSSGCFWKCRKCQKDRKKHQVDHTIHSLAFIQDDSIDVENPEYDHELRTIRRWR